jgi:ubiquitin-protein ligase
MTEDTLYSPNPLSPANGKLCTLYCKEDKTEYNNVIKRQSFYL